MRIVPGGAVRGSLGCSEFDTAAVADATEISRSGEPQTRTYEHELGTIEVYLEPHAPAALLAIVSATDVARSLARLGGDLGMRRALIEPRVERVGADDRAGFDEIRAELGYLGPGPRDAVVFTDHDAPGIADLLEAALRTDAGFIGVVGSRRHVGHYVEELRDRGIGDEALARIRSPLGLDLGGRGAQEVALSIAAGLVAARYGRDGGWLDR
jgi:xanthine dehydrogenase accessory factor